MECGCGARGGVVPADGEGHAALLGRGGVGVGDGLGRYLVGGLFVGLALGRSRFGGDAFRWRDRFGSVGVFSGGFAAAVPSFAFICGCSIARRVRPIV